MDVSDYLWITIFLDFFESALRGTFEKIEHPGALLEGIR